MLFLDVDGTICPNPAESMKPPSIWPTWKRVQHRWMYPNLLPVWISPEMIAQLETVPADRMWLSTWESRVKKWGLNDAIGWKDQAWVHLPKVMPGGRWDKRMALKDWMKRHPERPFVWIDNDHRMPAMADYWRTNLKVPHLLVRTDEQVGITKQQIARVRAFCRSLVERDVLELG
jgi:hypothetical protein